MTEDTNVHTLILISAALILSGSMKKARTDFAVEVYLKGSGEMESLFGSVGGLLKGKWQKGILFLDRRRSFEEKEAK